MVITMSNFADSSKIQTGDGENPMFLVRWRGRQEGPYSAEVIEKKLSANEIGLLHEILHNGRWITIRDYLAEQEATLRVQLQAREEQERRERDEADRKAREIEAQQRSAALVEEKRKNDLLEKSLYERQADERGRPTPTLPIKSHRGGLIVTCAVIGLFVCAPVCIAAWSMASNDLREMDAGLMDPSGRSQTSMGLSVARIGTLLWIVGIAFFFFAGGLSRF
jgi:hypothetical protein